jgi:hypothetical protein
MEFLKACERAVATAATFGVRIRPITMESAHRCLSGQRLSDGFSRLAELDRLDLSLEAIAVRKEFTGLFSDEEANEALARLLEAGYRF